ncbi:GGDEF domain-containing protein [Carnobacterium gallinarum]|uniref:GGDEF domain-containing protein n=1 Tax=Carnobacterium gallinarum TaxID=2749 RepID=UPI0005579742|nr:GGDEF domain-containing protein [Carnobacterium gallinarum]
MLSILNQIIINFSLIVSTALSCYFLGIKNTNRKNFTTKSTDSQSLTYIKTGLFGIFIGSSALVLSSNQIIVSSAINIDMRYVAIFFSVIYGSIYLGEIVTGVLIVGKTLEYILADGNDLIKYLNNALLTVFLLLVCILIKKNSLSLKSSIFYFIVVFFITRISIFSIYFFPILQKQKLINLAIYFIIFNLIFLVTVLIVNMAVSLESTMTLYRTGSVTDHLTTLYNRRMFINDLNIAFQNKTSTFCLAIMDIDNFKIINDRYGHHTGDLVLNYFSRILRQELLSEKGEIYRIGGEEFAYISFLSVEETTKQLESFRHRLSQSTFHTTDEQQIGITTSIGLTAFNHTVDSHNYEGSTAIYSRADRALYEAKRTGKNKLIVF